MQVFSNKESIGNLTKTGNTTVQLSPSVITIGAKQYTSGNLVCDISTSGVGGLDTGSIQALSSYYMYAVVDGNTSKIVCSLNSSTPFGFSQYKLIGGFFTNNSSQVDAIGILNNNNIIKRDSKIFWQRKELSSTINQGGAGEVASMSYYTLDIGKTYEAIGKIFSNGSGSINQQIKFDDGDSLVYQYITFKDISGAEEANHPIAFVFTATTNTMRTFVNHTSNGNIGAGQSHITLKELIDAEETI